MTIRSLLEIAENLRTQDNAHTAHPMFIVQQKREIIGVEDDYGNDTHTVWVQDGEEIDPKSEEFDEEEANEVTCMYIYEFVQAFFTRAEAERYIDSNSHNLLDPQIYVESAHRNYEFQSIRQALMENEFATPRLSDDVTDTALAMFVAQGSVCSSVESRDVWIRRHAELSVYKNAPGGALLIAEIEQLKRERLEIATLLGAVIDPGGRWGGHVATRVIAEEVAEHARLWRTREKS